MTNTKNRISSHDLRAAQDRLMFAKSEYCRKFKELTPAQVDQAEGILANCHYMMVLSAKKLLELGQ